ncbi:MAG: histidinol-phosphate transaminase [Clostridia bacterium]|nr:histidinol-phosphate transaminase [Clostridia bacterium]
MSTFLTEKYGGLRPYTPGEQPRERKYVKLNTNESPFPPAPKAQELARDQAENLMLYPDPECRELTRLIEERERVREGQVLLTNGSDEALNFAFMAYCDVTAPAVFANITYGFYKVFADLNGVPYEEIPLREDFSLDVDAFCKAKGTLFIANPNAPTGIALTRAEMEKIISSDPARVVVVDEAYVDFGGESCIPLLDQYPNLLVVQTFSKSRSMAGARLGFAVGGEALIDDLKRLKYSTNPYNVNRMTLAAGIGSIISEEYFANNCKKIVENREWAAAELSKLGFSMTNSTANFLFARHDKIGGAELYEKLKGRGVLVRHFTQKEIEDYNRITVGSMEEMQTLIKEIKNILEELK